MPVYSLDSSSERGVEQPNFQPFDLDRTEQAAQYSSARLMTTRSLTRRRSISRLSVLALVDEGLVAPGTCKFVPWSSDGHVFDALKRLVRRPLVAAFTTTEALLSTLGQTTPDVVFNLTQHALYDRKMDVHVCAVLELEGVPYTGTGPRGLMLCRDKALSKILAAEAGFRVPRHFVADSERVDVPADFRFPRW